MSFERDRGQENLVGEHTATIVGSRVGGKIMLQNTGPAIDGGRRKPLGLINGAIQGTEFKASRGQDLKASRGQDLKASRGQDLKASRGEDLKASLGQDLKASRRQDLKALQDAMRNVQPLRGDGGASIENTLKDIGSKPARGAASKEPAPGAEGKEPVHGMERKEPSRMTFHELNHKGDVTLAATRIMSASESVGVTGSKVTSGLKLSLDLDFDGDVEHRLPIDSTEDDFSDLWSIAEQPAMFVRDFLEWRPHMWRPRLSTTSPDIVPLSPPTDSVRVVNTMSERRLEDLMLDVEPALTDFVLPQLDELFLSEDLDYLASLP